MIFSPLTQALGRHVAKASPNERKKLAREIAVIYAKAIYNVFVRKKNPDGTAFTKRKPSTVYRITGYEIGLERANRAV
ncbi:phage virion morphogenesis protein [Proteus vulgaris]|uniref:phage virion morphogenesis protein n=1 Tax=Proteus vulgaris TaxID=585 RepID=UPI00214B3BA7|nr:phage virion morphogenesis protein [Proteus vulgaris]